MSNKQEIKEMLQSFRDSIDTKIVDRHGRNMEAVYAQVSGFNMNWGINGCGFGQYYFGYDEDLGRVVIDSETMGPRFIELVLKQMLKTAVYGDFENIEKIAVDITMSEALSEIEKTEMENFEPYYISYEQEENGRGYDTVKIKVEPQGDEAERWKIIKFFFSANIIDIAAHDEKMSFVDGIKKYATGVEAYYKTIEVKDR